jgi:transposase
LIPQRPGERIKTDRRDARNLALALRAGTLTAVHIPIPEQEAFRDVVRAWQQSKRDITAAQQRLKSFLLRNDIRYSGRPTWNTAHRRWLSELVLRSAPQQIIFQKLVDAINERERRRDRLEPELDALAPGWAGYRLAQALLPFRGIQKTVAYTLIAETGDLALLSPQPLHGLARARPRRTQLRQHPATRPNHPLRQPLGTNTSGRGRVGVSIHPQGQRRHRTPRPDH